MDSVIYEQSQEKPQRYDAIRCQDCKCFVSSRREAVKKHRGHALNYTDKQGNPIDL